MLLTPMQNPKMSLTRKMATPESRDNLWPPEVQETPPARKDTRQIRRLHQSRQETTIASPARVLQEAAPYRKDTSHFRTIQEAAPYRTDTTQFRAIQEAPPNRTDTSPLRMVQDSQPSSGSVSFKALLECMNTSSPRVIKEARLLSMDTRSPRMSQGTPLKGPDRSQSPVMLGRKNTSQPRVMVEPERMEKTWSRANVESPVERKDQGQHRVIQEVSPRKETGPGRVNQEASPRKESSQARVIQEVPACEETSQGRGTISHHLLPQELSPQAHTAVSRQRQLAPKRKCNCKRSLLCSCKRSGPHSTRSGHSWNSQVAERPLPPGIMSQKWRF